MGRICRSAWMWTVVWSLVGIAGCSQGAGPKDGRTQQTEVPGAASSPNGSRALEIATAVSEGIGSVGTYGSGDATCPILVFEEEHNSPAIRLEEAIALVRLYRDYGLRSVGMEGAPAGQVFDAKWFHSLADIDAIKPGVAVALLSQGEMNAGEFMAMVFPDVRVVGLEDPALYAVTPPESTGEAVISYLLRIAIDSLSPKQEQEAARLLKQDQEKGLDYILEQDPWVAKILSELQDEKQSRSIESIVEMYREIKRRAEQRAVEIPEEDRRKMDEDIRFFSAAAKRTNPLVSNLQAMLAAKDLAATAMVIGAGHTERCCEILNGQRACFAVVSPASLGKEMPSDLPHLAYERKLRLLPVSDKGVASFLVDYLPGPVVDKPWFMNETKLYYIAAYLAKLSAGGEFPPSDEAFEEMCRTTGIDIDRSSLREDDHQVVFSAVIQVPGGHQRRIYGRAAKVAAIEVADLSRADATEKLLKERLRQLNSEKKHSQDLVVLVAPDTIAIFSKSAEGVKNRI